MNAQTLIPPPERASDALFERCYAESLRESTREALLERLETVDAGLAEAHLDFCAEFGPVTHAQFVDMLERTNNDLWDCEYNRQSIAAVMAGSDD